MSAIEVLLKERHALCDTMAAVGPDAPTLCTGWLTADLAAHLLAREKRPDAAPGVVLGGPFAKHTQRVMDGYKAKGYDVMLSELRQGPPKWMRAGPLAKANVGENWIHHEDVRRANGQGPRPRDPAISEILWGSLALAAVLARRKLEGAGLVLKAADGRERTVKAGEALVTVRGQPDELALWMAGRQEAAVVELEGDPAAVAIVLATKLSI
jgi:uncharacterized protein (TIGR03085 family)